MSLLLRISADRPAVNAWRWWLAVTDTAADGLDPTARLPDLAHRLEQAFDQSRDDWWETARRLGGTPSAELSHSVACGAFGSDFGLMLAWRRLAAELAAGSESVLMLCDDPWLFREIAGLPGVEAGKPPGLLKPTLRLGLRGLAARCALALRLVRAVLATRRLKTNIPAEAPILLVYGHPQSRPDGTDAYFGSLMKALPQLRRLLHADAPPTRASELAADGRSASIHAWGSALFALTLPLVAWRPSPAEKGGRFGMLIRRAAVNENGGGGPAMNRWQIHCQRRFLAERRPSVMCWPWENHCWEKDLCRAATAAGIATIGYQHTVVGRHQINQSPRANPDGLAAIPWVMVANGPEYRQQMIDWDIPEQRIVTGGAFRLTEPKGRPYDQTAPVFVPLSANPSIAALQLDAARRIAATGRRVLVKDHPMYPQAFTEGGGLERTQVPMTEQPALSAVVYSTGTTGLEGLLLGLPTFRLLPEDRVAIEILPDAVRPVTVTLDELVPAMDRIEPPSRLPFGRLFSPVDMGVWKNLLIGGIERPATDGEESPCAPTP
ncbi:hypothetical protein CCC_00779 [Paramagnetospirillum magnetotacticum MS-1]|uniref:Uncharacterized protein n=1 Tax=Paramagnetospirillum magnetotacticum MS-1 TaxID=272627 RepID=A0A0C2YRG2_PARME|nr:hypothetical protein [Paramagnetospirillum magnetotacticum]KIL97718.1 hypothetical protein CCC_00779 [Paramagnetospirillum magnetotacticum MS-1]